MTGVAGCWLLAPDEVARKSITNNFKSSLFTRTLGMGLALH